MDQLEQLERSERLDLDFQDLKEILVPLEPEEERELVDRLVSLVLQALAALLATLEPPEFLVSKVLQAHPALPVIRERQEQRAAGEWLVQSVLLGQLVKVEQLD